MKTFIRSTNWRLGKIVAIVCAIVLAIGTKSRLDAADAESSVNVRPNILFIFTDDHAISAISAYGSKLIQTPNIDRIAREGMLFKNCFVTNSICGPSRAVILTGRHSHENGFIDNQSRFDGSQTTFPKLLQKVGYQTAIIGKWHLVSDPTGFDHWDVLPGQGSYYNPELLSQSKTP
ncbi:MAG: sulfatase-like hydrolase/transferase, partial [Pirellulales bacterium]|nr:sulfatase-like hydrolase/transferase [Pirellulales bacterium]